MKEKLKPCPFCGSENVVIINYGYARRAMCSNCCASSKPVFASEYGESDQLIDTEVTKLWNRRANDG